jgi:hypothetical protein
MSGGAVKNPHSKLSGGQPTAARMESAAKNSHIFSWVQRRASPEYARAMNAYACMGDHGKEAGRSVAYTVQLLLMPRWPRREDLQRGGPGREISCRCMDRFFLELGHAPRRIHIINVASNIIKYPNQHYVHKRHAHTGANSYDNRVQGLSTPFPMHG